MRFPGLALTGALVAAMAAPGAFAQHGCGSVIIDAAGAAYVIVAEHGDDTFLLVAMESNGARGIQGDEVCDLGALAGDAPNPCVAATALGCLPF